MIHQKFVLFAYIEKHAIYFLLRLFLSVTFMLWKVYPLDAVFCRQR